MPNLPLLNQAEHAFAQALIAWPLKQFIRDWQADPELDMDSWLRSQTELSPMQAEYLQQVAPDVPALADHLKQEASLPEKRIPTIASQQLAAKVFSHADVDASHRLIDASLNVNAHGELTYEHSRYPAKRRIMDDIYALGMEEVFSREEGEKIPFDLLRHLPSIQQREAKWHYALALTNEVNDLGIKHDEDLVVLSRAYAQLATFERGANNPYMAHEYRLRHNPAIHSLHVVGLVNELVERVERKHADILTTPAAREELENIRQLFARAGLVHDMGELRGEKSVAGDRATMTAEELEAFEEERAHLEGSIWEREMHWHADVYALEKEGQLSWLEALDLRKNHNRLIHVEQRMAHVLENMADGPEKQDELDRLQSYYDKYATREEAGFASLERPRQTNLSMTEDWKQEFELAEEISLRGRLIKLIERLQTQQDYLRWNGVASATPMEAMVNGREYEADFKMNYTLDLILGERADDGTRKPNGIVHLMQEETSPVLLALAEETLTMAKECNLVIAANLPTNFPSGVHLRDNLGQTPPQPDSNIAQLVNYFLEMDLGGSRQAA